MMGDRPVSFIQLDQPNGIKTNCEIYNKKRKQKAKPPNLNMMDPRGIITEKRRHGVHGYSDTSPPYSPNSPLSRESSGSSGTYSPLSSSPRAFAMDWQQQPKHRSLTPIPEMKLNSNGNGIHREETMLEQRHPDFLRELSTHDFNVDDIRVIVGRNKIRIIGENKENTNHNSNNKAKPQEFHKVVDIPPCVNPLSIKVKKYPGKIVIHGFNNSNKKPLQRGSDNNTLTPENKGTLRINVNIPPGYESKHLRFKTVTKHYLIVSGSSEEDPSDDNTNGLNKGFVETFELPSEPDKYHISSKLLDKKTLLVEVPLAHRPRSNSM